MSQILYYTDPSDFFKLVSDEENEVSDIQLVSDDMVRVAFKKKDFFSETLTMTNVCLAAQTTALAR